MGKKSLRHHLALMGLAVLFLFLTALMLQSGGRASTPIMWGSEPPEDGDWHVNETTQISDAELTVNGSVYVHPGAILNIIDSELTIAIPTGKYSYGPIYHTRMLKVESGAELRVTNSVLNLDTFMAIGQASITFEGGSKVTTYGRFIGSCALIFATDTDFTNTAPPVGHGQHGEDAILILDGNVTSECVRVSINNLAGDAGASGPGANGSNGGLARIITNVSIWIDSVITNRAGNPGGGGLGLMGMSSGSGGLGGDADIYMNTSYLEGTVITSLASDGGHGALGAENSSGDAGDGGDGSEGGNCLIDIDASSTLEIYGCTIGARSGAGGSGGSGGRAINGTGGTAGHSASAGWCRIDIHSIDNITMKVTEIASTGGEGGYGGDFGRHEVTQGGFGVPRAGGSGGLATILVNSKGGMVIERTSMVSKGGPGLDGGAGYDQGETGGPGGDAEVLIHMEADIIAERIDLLAVGGNGGDGGIAVSAIRGNGGDGGDAMVEFTGLASMLVKRFEIKVEPGKGGRGNRPAWYGVDGIPTFDLDTRLLEMWHGTLNMPLDDLHGEAEGDLYNVTFETEGLIPVLPIGDAIVRTWSEVNVRVVNSADPSKAKPVAGWNVIVRRVVSEEIIACYTTDENGCCTLWLLSHIYSSNLASYMGEYFFSAIPVDGSTFWKVRGHIQGNTIIIIVVQYPRPDSFLEIERPENEGTYSFEGPGSRWLETYGFFSSHGEGNVTAIRVKLHPGHVDPSDWTGVDLVLSPVPLSELEHDEDKWGYFFPPVTNGTRWPFFYRFDILGEEFHFDSGWHIYEATAWAGVSNWTSYLNLSLEIAADARSPKVNVTTTLDRIWNITSVTVNGTAGGLFGVELVEYRVDGGSWHAANGTTDWHLELDMGALDDGEHLLEVRAYDGERYSTVVEEPFTVVKDFEGSDDGDDWKDNSSVVASITLFAVSIALIVLVIALDTLRRRA